MNKPYDFKYNTKYTDIELLRTSDNRIMSHCSSIAFDDDDGMWITFYTGPECSDDQRVHVMYKNNDSNYYKLMTLPVKTGNPVIWCYNNQIYLMYSLFKDIDNAGNKPGKMVERWKFCDNYLLKLRFNGSEIIIESEDFIEDGFGLLGRCQPIMFNNKILIPLYREKDPRCEIWTIENDKMIRLSTFGEVTGGDNRYFGSGVAIQPTLTYHENGIVAYCRNVDKMKNFAWFTTSNDGINWGKLIQSSIPNHNSSLILIPNPNPDLNPAILYNPTVDRSSLLLNKYMIGIPIKNRRLSYSYPNYAYDNDENLHLVYTNCGLIAHQIIYKEVLSEII